MSDNAEEIMEGVIDSAVDLYDKYAGMGQVTNPYGLQHNCVFVTIAHLLEKSLDQFLAEAGLMQGDSAEERPKFEDVAKMLQETGKQIFTYKIEDPRGFHFRTYAADSPISMWGVLFLRTDGSGHCVVFENSDFRDYQPADARTIVGGEANELEKSIAYIFSISGRAVFEATTIGDDVDGNEETPMEDNNEVDREGDGREEGDVEAAGGGHEPEQSEMDQAANAPLEDENVEMNGGDGADAEIDASTEQTVDEPAATAPEENDNMDANEDDDMEQHTYKAEQDQMEE